MGINPAFENSTWACLDNIWWINVDIQTEDEGSVCGLELGGCSTPRRDPRCPWGWRGRIPARQMSFVRPVGEGSEWVREVGDRPCLSSVLFSQMAYWSGTGRGGVRAGIVALRGRVEIRAVASSLASCVAVTP